MIKAGIIGASGYTGFETIRWLSRHPQVELSFITARTDAGKPLSALYTTSFDIKFQRVEDVNIWGVDVVFPAVPHGTAAEVAANALKAGARVIDLSADFRLHSAENYAKWYHHTHPTPHLLDSAVYGLTEWARDAVKTTQLVANPGCYPTSILLAVAPMLKAGLLENATIIADSKSGVSGAGRAAKIGSMFAEVNNNLKPYGIGHSHRHVAEM